MKNTFFTLWLTSSLLIGCYTEVYSQYILAGQHNTSNYFFDIVPDTTLTGPNNHAVPLPPAVYRIDINGDGILDFYLYAVGYWSNGAGNTTIAIKSYDTSFNQVAFGYYDTCNYVYSDTTISCLHEMAKSFRMNDTINSKLEWSTNVGLYLAYTNWMLMAADCEGNGFRNDSLGNYIAVRVLRPNDTIYGWIKVTNVNYLTFTVQAFASSLNCTGISHHKDFMRIYPVPTSGMVTVETEAQNYELVVYDLFGIEILRREPGSKTFHIDLTGKAKGVYIVKLTQGNTTIFKKIIKQ
ncbi:MAG TPA: T9SS type A sorting domain-containing protein [Bacteroidales bacterium]|nr:T9SS type A sorting domain-containing protein [Bacteroidales bacterium]